MITYGAYNYREDYTFEPLNHVKISDRWSSIRHFEYGGLNFTGVGELLIANCGHICRRVRWNLNLEDPILRGKSVCCNCLEPEAYNLYSCGICEVNKKV